MRFTRKFLSSPRQRQRKIDRAFRNLAELLLVAYFFFVVAALLSSHPSLRIAKITVEGARAVDAPAVMAMTREVLEEKFLWKIERGNALLLPRGELVAAVKNVDRRIASVTVTTPSPKDLVVTIEEYVPAFIWCPPRGGGAAEPIAAQLQGTADAPSCYFADRSGYIFDDAPRFSGTTLRVYRTAIEAPDGPIGRRILPDGALALLERMADELGLVGISVYAVDALGSGDYRFAVNAPWALLWSDTKDPKASAENLALVVERLNESGEDMAEISVIDLRFGDKVFYK